MTRQKKLVRNSIKGFLSLVVLSLLAVITSCSNDDDVQQITHKVVYKAEVSAGSNITKVDYYGLDFKDEMIPVTGVSGITWTSPEITKRLGIPKGGSAQHIALVDVKATGANASSTLKVQIYVDGILKKEKVVTGQDLSADIQYDIEYKVN